MGGLLLLAVVGWLQGELDRGQDRTVRADRRSRAASKGEYLKNQPFSAITILGAISSGSGCAGDREKTNSADEYAWNVSRLGT